MLSWILGGLDFMTGVVSIAHDVQTLRDPNASAGQKAAALGDAALNTVMDILLVHDITGFAMHGLEDGLRDLWREGDHLPHPDPHHATDPTETGGTGGNGGDGGNGGHGGGAPGGGQPPSGYGPAHNAANGAKLRQYYKDWQRLGPPVTTADDGERFYDALKPPTRPGRVVGSRYVVEWTPAGDRIGWYESIEANGNIRILHPKNFNGADWQFLPHVLLDGNTIEGYFYVGP